MSQASEMSQPEVSDALKQIKTLFFSQQSGQLSLSLIAGFSDEELNAAYAVACQKLNVGDLEGATKLFAMLCVLKHQEGKFWRGLGLCNHRQKAYQVADLVYAMALTIDPHDVIARCFRAEVALWMNFPMRAQIEAERAIEDGRAQQKRELIPYIQRAESVLAAIQADDVGGVFERG